MKVKSGHIPEEVIYVVAKPREITIEWDDVEREDGESAPKETVFPVFVCDATNDKTLATARNWAKNTAAVYDRKTNTQSYDTLPDEVVRKNEPFTGIHVVGLDVRHNGGRAWKCVIDNGSYYCDLREDNLLDIMRTVGIEKGGYLNGEYMWARIGTEMKLIRVGSEIHTAVIGANDRRNMPTLAKKDIKPWHLYQMKNGDVWLHVGMVRGWHPKESVPSEWEQRHNDAVLEQLCSWAGAKYGGGYSQSSYTSKYGSDMTRPGNPIRLEIPYKRFRQSLWVKIASWQEGKTVEAQKKSLENTVKARFDTTNSYGALWDVRFGSDPKVVDELGEFKYETLFQDIRDAALKAYLVATDVTNIPKHDQRHDPVLRERERLRSCANYLQFGTVYPDDGEPDPSYDTWATWMLSTEPK